MSQLWTDPARLNEVSQLLQWFGLGLIVFGVLLSAGRLVVDRRARLVTREIQAEQQRVQQEREAEFQRRLDARQNEIGQLKSDADTLKLQAETLKSQTESLRPIRQPISSGSAIVTWLTTDDDANLFVLEGATLARVTAIGEPDVFLSFFTGDDIVLELVSLETTAEKRQGGGLLIRSLVTLSPVGRGVGSYIDALKEVTKVVIRIRPIQANHDIHEGSADVTLNNVLKFRLVVPAQRTTTRTAVIKDLSPMYKAIDANK